MNLNTFIETFSEEQYCKSFFFNCKYPNGKAVCPKCNCDKSYIVEKGRRYKCANNKCYARYYLTADTIFHSSNINEYTKLIYILYFCWEDKKSSFTLKKEIGVTQKSAWGKINRIKKTIQLNNFKKLPFVEFCKEILSIKTKGVIVKKERAVETALD